MLSIMDSDTRGVDFRRNRDLVTNWIEADTQRIAEIEYVVDLVLQGRVLQDLIGLVLNVLQLRGRIEGCAFEERQDDQINRITGRKLRQRYPLEDRIVGADHRVNRGLVVE